MLLCADAEMSTSSLGLDEPLQKYLLDVSVREHPILRRLREHTASMPEANLQIAPEQGQFLQFLVALIGAQRIVEIGTFTGYSALAMALALPDEGRLLTCDISHEWTGIARHFWQQADVASRIDLRIGRATETLQRLLADDWAGTVDLVFIDADKVSYSSYYESALELVKTGGIIAVDNVLWDGAVADPNQQDDETRAIRALNQTIGLDHRVDSTMLPLADGLTLARKKPV